MRRYRTFVLMAAWAALLPGCNGPPPTWQRLLAAKIGEQFPAYSVAPLADGNLTVSRPGKPDAAVDVNAIAQFCQRGWKDCNYATDQMLLGLQE